MNDRTELYPCGVRVSVPSLGINSTGLNNRRTIIRPHSGRVTSLHSPVLSYKRVSAIVRSNTMPQIIFSDDIIETMCPETITYDKAREKMRRLWNLRTDRYGLAKKRKRLHTNNVVRAESLKKSSVKPLQFTDVRAESLKKSSVKPLQFTDKSQTPAVFLPVLQPIFPRPLSEWTTSAQSEDDKHKRLDKVSRGSRRWTALPIRAPTPTELQLSIRPIEIVEDNLCPSNNCRKQEEEPVHHDNKTKQLLRVFKELISAWRIFVQPNDLQLTKAMASMSSQCASQQMYGLEIVCKLLFRPMAASSLNIDDGISLKHEDIWRKVKCLLEAETERVRILSAILLYCYDKDLTNDKKISDTLLSSLNSLSYSEKWSATQTLAITGSCDIDIVTILFDHLCRQTLSDCDKERISTLLTKLSNDSTLIVSVLAEKLNSRCWKERHTSCFLFPLLCHPLNKDVSYRLLHCTLHDWNPQVRLMAAQALGKTGNGKLIHDAIKEDITNNNELTKLNALKKIHLLHIMTATILPLYVQCFKDDHDSIKLEVISIAEDLGITDDDVMSALTLLLQDKCWKVKAHAIKAVGTLKYTSERVISHLLWAARFEQLPVLRAEVCHTLAILGNKDERIITALKDLLNVEDNAMVLREARKSLHMLGQDSIAVDDMLDIVCAEVKSLSTKERITRQILSAEKKQMVEHVMMRHN